MFPVAPTSIIVAALVTCWLYVVPLNIIGLNKPGYSSFAFSCTFIANFKFCAQVSCFMLPSSPPITNISCAAYSSPIFTVGAYVLSPIASLCKSITTSVFSFSSNSLVTVFRELAYDPVYDG